MADPERPDGTPQFGTAEYDSSGPDRCRTCEQLLPGEYYRVNGATTCAACAEKAAGQLPKDTHKAFGRGVLFGLGGAFLGLVIYSTVGIVTGLAIGYVSLAVGYIVGKAIMMGSWGIGGRRYQVVAALLTYAAVSMSAIPVGISMLIQQGGLNPEAQVEQATEPPVEQAADPPEKAGETTANDEKQDLSTEPEASLLGALVWLAVIGLASPFLELAEPFNGLIGLVILFVGIHIAWRMTAARPIEILGPFKS